MTDKHALHGRYYDSTSERVRVQNDRLKWQNQLSKQVTHKALDEPLLDEDEMHVDARRKTTVTHTGLGFKELLLLAALGLPALGTAGLAGAGIAATVLQHLTEPHAVGLPPTPDSVAGAHGTATAPAAGVPPRDTRIVPGLRFGPEKEDRE
jgi:hypothetical protein